MFCPECGTKNEDGALFCENCGAKMEVEAVQVDATNAQPAQPAQGQAPQQVNQPVQPKQAVQLSKGTKVAIIGAVIAVIAIVILVNIVKKSVSPESVATNYFKAVAEADWEEVYSYYDLSEDDFINKNMFSKSVKGRKKINYTNYAIRQSTKNIDEAISEAAKRENNNEDGIYKTINIEYAEKNSDSTNQVYAVKLVKLAKKKMLFFDNWKVIPEETMAKKYQIRTLKGLDVYVDGKKLSDKYLQDDKEKSSYEDTIDVYEIEAMFRGNHKLEFKGDFIETFKEDVEVSAGSSDGYSYTNPKIKETFIDELKKNSEVIVEKLYTSAIDDKKFSEIDLPYGIFEEEKTNIEQRYDDLCNNVDKVSYSGGIKLKSFEKKEFEVTDESSYITEGTVSATISYRLKYKGEFIKEKNDKEEKKKAEDDVRGTMSFKYVDGKWQISRLYVGNIYYYWY